MKKYIQYPIVFLFTFWDFFAYSQFGTEPQSTASRLNFESSAPVGRKTSVEPVPVATVPKLKTKLSDTLQGGKDLPGKIKVTDDVWFSPTTKLSIEYPYKKSFMSLPRINDIDLAQIPTCKKKFHTLCGTEDFPVAEKFIFCLQDKFDQYRNNPSCATMGHYLIHINFYRHLAYSTEPCKTILDKCTKNPPIPGVLPWQCALADKKVPPLCITLINDFIRMRVFAAKMYDEKLICPPGGCN